MLRLRFHGRGGHGTKTASRIVGTAAFLAGLHAQDSPLYGAERRGAPLAACTRIDRDSIRERGVILDPDLLLVADETLLADPAAGVLSGSETASALFVNSPVPAAELAQRHGIACPVLCLDLTGPALDRLGRGTAVSASLGAVGCALTGLIDEELMARAVREELADLHLGADAISSNVELARQAFRGVAAVPLRPGHPAQPAVALHQAVPVTGAAGVPILLATGNTQRRHTGAWRLFRPVIDRAACTRCGLCLLRCPDGAITLDQQGYPVIDYDNCKGCMICLEACPVHRILEEKETQP